MINTNVRFFAYCIDSNEEIDICEVNESTFIKLHNQLSTIEYERNTVHENGVNQICLTVKLKNDYPYKLDIESY